MNTVPQKGNNFDFDDFLYNFKLRDNRITCHLYESKIIATPSKINHLHKPLWLNLQINIIKMRGSQNE